jgi:hypothetical protein
MEEAMPRLRATMEEIAGVVGQLGELADRGTAELHELDAAGATGVGPRLPALARFAAGLESPADRLVDLSARYALDIDRIDRGVSYLIDRLEAEPQLLGEAPDFPGSLVRLGDAATSSMASSDTLAESISTLGQASRVLRVPTRRVSDALISIHAVSAPIWTWADRASRFAR